MHVLFAHNNYPAQFGHIAKWLVRELGWKSTFISRLPPAFDGPIERVQYVRKGGARSSTHYTSRPFENAAWESAAIFETLRNRPDIQPDLVVTHSGFFHSLFFRELYDAPVISYFEYFYAAQQHECEFRTDLPGGRDNWLYKMMATRARNATLLLDLHNCDVGYSPLTWQRNCLPQEFHPKVRVLHDGVDTELWSPALDARREVGGKEIPAGIKIVTYAARGLEPIRGFDMFMQVARRLCELRDDVFFVVVGKDEVIYGADKRFLGDKTFKEWALAQAPYDSNRFLFIDWLEPTELAKLFAVSDLHMYFTAPFVVSWSLVNAMSCGAAVLASRTGGVEEIIEDGSNGYLEDFFDVEGMAIRAAAVLDGDPEHAQVRQRARHTVGERFSYEACLPRFKELAEEALGSPPTERSAARGPVGSAPASR